MRSLVYHVAITLDGFIADTEHGVSAFLTEGDHIPEYLAALKSYEAVVMGRKTYDFGLRFGVTDPYPWLDTYVVSKSMTESPSPRVQIADDGVALVRRLKEASGGPIYLAGGGELARGLFDAGLVDEVVVKVNPALLGAGIPLAPRLASTTKLRLRSTKVHDVGVVVLKYDVVA
jgi:dihydrofolate reductase